MREQAGEPLSVRGGLEQDTTTTNMQSAVPREQLRDERNFFQPLPMEDAPTDQGFHVTFVSSAESVKLRSLPGVETDGMLIQTRGTIARLQEVVVRITAITALPMTEPVSDNLLHYKTFVHDITTDPPTIQLSNPAYITHGLRAPGIADVGLRNNPVISSAWLTVDGTKTGTPLTDKEYSQLNLSRVQESIVIATDNCFGLHDTSDELVAQRPKVALSMLRTLTDQDPELIGLVVKNDDLIPVALDKAMIDSIAREDPMLDFVGWIGRRGDDITVYGRDSLLGGSVDDTRIPYLRIETSLGLDVPEKPDPGLAARVHFDLNRIAGLSVEGISLVSSSPEPSVDLRKSTDSDNPDLALLRDNPVTGLLFADDRFGMDRTVLRNPVRAPENRRLWQR